MAEEVKEKPLYEVTVAYEKELKTAFRTNLGEMVAELTKKLVEQVRKDDV